MREKIIEEKIVQGGHIHVRMRASNDVNMTSAPEKPLASYLVSRNSKMPFGDEMLNCNRSFLFCTNSHYKCHR